MKHKKRVASHTSEEHGKRLAREWRQIVAKGVAKDWRETRERVWRKKMAERVGLECGERVLLREWRVGRECGERVLLREWGEREWRVCGAARCTQLYTQNEEGGGGTPLSLRGAGMGENTPLLGRVG